MKSETTLRSDHLEVKIDEPLRSFRLFSCQKVATLVFVYRYNLEQFNNFCYFSVYVKILMSREREREREIYTKTKNPQIFYIMIFFIWIKDNFWITF